MDESLSVHTTITPQEYHQTVPENEKVTQSQTDSSKKGLAWRLEAVAAVYDVLFPGSTKQLEKPEQTYRYHKTRNRGCRMPAGNRGGESIKYFRH